MSAAVASGAESQAALDAQNTARVDAQNPNIEIVRGQNFEVGPRYGGLRYIGEGAYGMVV
jgi:hypothetical protein